MVNKGELTATFTCVTPGAEGLPPDSKYWRQADFPSLSRPKVTPAKGCFAPAKCPTCAAPAASIPKKLFGTTG
jgi:hypothetical protein